MNRSRTAKWSVVGAAAVLASLLTPVSAANAAEPLATAPPTATAATDTLTTWGHDNPIATSDPIAGEQVRQSSFYDASVATAADPATAYSSFVYMSVPRSGDDKMGYSEDDGAEFSSSADLTMSWSSFEYAADVWVNVTLKTGQPITSADQVTIRPTDLGLEKELVDSSTIRVKVPYSEDGYRFSVEFDPQLITSYNDLSGPAGCSPPTPTGTGPCTPSRRTPC